MMGSPPRHEKKVKSSKRYTELLSIPGTMGCNGTLKQHP